MKKIFKTIINSIKSCADKIVSKIKARFFALRPVVLNQCGEGYIDTGVKIIIGVVIGGVILAGLYTLFNSTVIPTLNNKITEMFNHGG